jgi:hypothetical protein
MNSNVLQLLTLILAFSPLLSAQVVTAATTIHGLFEQDQRDQQIDADSLAPSEQQKLRVHYDQREDQVKRLMQNGEIHKPQDFFDAGVILTHSHVPEDQLLAHLAFTAAAFEGITEAKHLAATSLDRYLVFSKQTPLFGTIFQLPYQGWHHDVSPSMNDSIRAAFCIPSLKQLDKEFEQQKNGKDLPESGHDEFWNVELKGCH